MSTNAAAEIIEDVGDDNPNGSQYLTFLLNGQEYAVDILKVQGIQGWSSYTHLPNTPDYVLGVINLRGAIVPIVDLRIRFALKDVEYNDLTVVIVVKIANEKSEKVVGLVVDAVSEVYNIDQSELKIPPDFGADVDTEYVAGLATIEDKLVITIDVDRLVGESILNAVSAEASA